MRKTMNPASKPQRPRPVPGLADAGLCAGGRLLATLGAERLLSLRPVIAGRGALLP
jgi:hypothetical protein